MNNRFAGAFQQPAAPRRSVPFCRQGKKHVGVYVTPDVARQLRVLAAQKDTSVQQLIEEAIEMLVSEQQRC